MSYSPRDFRALWKEFSAPSWQAWASIEDAILARAPDDPELVRRLTRRDSLPTSPVKEAWVVAGRGGGKSRWAARLAVYFAAGRDYRRVAGERIYAAVIAPDRRQSALVLRYVVGLLRSVPALERMIVSETRDAVELTNGVTVEVVTASTAAPRGRSYCLALLDECAFFPSDGAADPDTEVLRAIRPALARVPGSLLAAVSSPYARRGELYRAWRDHYGKSSPHVLVVQAETLDLNPEFDLDEILRAYDTDPASAAAEYGGQFRRDVEAFVSREAVEACVTPGRRELSPVPKCRYSAFVDPSGGSADSFTLAIGHTEEREGAPVAIVDAIRERRPPFSPEGVVAEYAGLLRRYRVGRVVGDRYAGEWPREAFRRYGIRYETADQSKSDLYRDALATLNAGRVELVDDARLVAQFVALERRTSRGGRDLIDHPPSGHDDLANCVAGLAVQLAVVAASARRGGTWGRGRRDRTTSAPRSEASMSTRQLALARRRWARTYAPSLLRPGSSGKVTC